LSNSEHRRIASKYFYDAQGSAIYTEITQLDEYYLFMQELKLLQQRANDIKSTILRHSDFQARSTSTVHFIELGCGDGAKVEAWLKLWLQSKSNVSVVYHPVDISQHAIDSLVQHLKKIMGQDMIDQCVNPVCSTFDKMYTKLNTDTMGIQVVMLLGSTIGNFAFYGPSNVKCAEDSPVMEFLRSVRHNLKVGDWFVCAFDMCKDVPTMIRAYNDSKGVTTAFNFNLLARLNRELNFNFDLVNYHHYAAYNPLRRQMESWMISTKRQTVTDQHGFIMVLQPYDAIQTELSTKYTHEDIRLLMDKNDMRIIECYTTDDDRFPYTLYMAQAI
jgi:L-histidine N-alpha-methyltransferase